jgi:hypothetical protein
LEASHSSWTQKEGQCISTAYCVWEKEDRWGGRAWGWWAGAPGWGSGSGDAGDDGVAPGAGSFGSHGADADTDKAARGEVLEGVVGPGADSGGAALLEGGTAGIGHREGLHFITTAVGDAPPAGAAFAGEGGRLNAELDRSGEDLRRGGCTAQATAGTDQGLVAGVGTLTLLGKMTGHSRSAAETAEGK